MIGSLNDWVTAAPAFGELRMNTLGKPIPMAWLPGNWCASDGWEVLPWRLTRADAAATLHRARNLQLRGQARITTEAAGRYRLSTFNTLILNTRPVR